MQISERIVDEVSPYRAADGSVVLVPNPDTTDIHILYVSCEQVSARTTSE